MGIHAQPGSIGLGEPPKDVLGSLVDIWTSGVLWEELFERDFGEFGFENVDFVEEEDLGRRGREGRGEGKGGEEEEEERLVVGR